MKSKENEQILFDINIAKYSSTSLVDKLSSVVETRKPVYEQNGTGIGFSRQVLVC